MHSHAFVKVNTSNDAAVCQSSNSQFAISRPIYTSVDRVSPDYGLNMANNNFTNTLQAINSCHSTMYKSDRFSNFIFCRVSSRRSKPVTEPAWYDCLRYCSSRSFSYPVTAELSMKYTRLHRSIQVETFSFIQGAPLQARAQCVITHNVGWDCWCNRCSNQPSCSSSGAPFISDILGNIPHKLYVVKNATHRATFYRYSMDLVADTSVQLASKNEISTYSVWCQFKVIQGHRFPWKSKGRIRRYISN